MAQRRTWISILIAVLVIGGVAILAVVGGSVYWITQHVDTQVTPISNAADEFARERARFAGAQPILAVSGGENPRVQRLPGVPVRSSGPMETLHARIYDPVAGKIIRADVPFWLIRAAKSLTFLPDMGSITLEELEKHGPGLLINGSGDAGEEILVWVD